MAKIPKPSPSLQPTIFYQDVRSLKLNSLLFHPFIKIDGNVNFLLSRSRRRWERLEAIFPKFKILFRLIFLWDCGRSKVKHRNGAFEKKKID